MTGRKNRHELLYPLGVTPTEEGAEILVLAEGKKVSLLYSGEEKKRRRKSLISRKGTGSETSGP